MKLFCFPYAGGSAALFRKWTNLDPRIVLAPVELAGRGRRANEPLYRDMRECVADVHRVMARHGFDHPYALFGHSMGAMIAYELAQFIRQQGLPAPAHFFFSGRRAPHLRDRDEKDYSVISDEALREEILSLGGTPPEFFEYPELVKMFLPLLRNDFRLSEEGPFGGPVFPLDGDITVFLGKTDDLTAEECDGWKLHTHRTCSVHYLNGGHFFLHDQAEGMIDVINSTLLSSHSLRPSPDLI